MTDQGDRGERTDHQDSRTNLSDPLGVSQKDAPPVGGAHITASVPAAEKHAPKQAPRQGHFLLCLDRSAYAKAIVREAIRLLPLFPSTAISAIHVTDGPDAEDPAPLRMAQAVCQKTGISPDLIARPGKPREVIPEVVESQAVALVFLGAQGEGAVAGGLLGSVAERLCRSLAPDLCLIRTPDLSLDSGPILSAVDGSPRAFGAGEIAIRLAKQFDKPLHLLAVDSPGAKKNAEAEAGALQVSTTNGHGNALTGLGTALGVLRSLAEEAGVTVHTHRAPGKPYLVLSDLARELGGSVMVLGRTGRDGETDPEIGHTAENVLRLAPCHVWVTRHIYHPPARLLFREAISWTAAAEDVLAAQPAPIREKLRLATLRLAQTQGTDMITAELVKQAQALSFSQQTGQRPESVRASYPWSRSALQLLRRETDPVLAAALRLRAEEKARAEGADRVEESHVHAAMVVGSGGNEPEDR